MTKLSMTAAQTADLCYEKPAEPGRLLSVTLDVDYPGRPGALRHVSFEMAAGEILALVGESGSGKSTLGLALMRLLDDRGAQARGEILLEGRDLMLLSEREMRRVRGQRIGLVLQSPLAALNPMLRLGRQFKEAWHAHTRVRSGFRESLFDIMARVQMPPTESFLDLYPRQLSVGLAQRALIAMALLHRPSLLIADEPTSALDAVTQAEILALFTELNRTLHTSILFISHDLLSVAAVSHRVAILHQGELVEQGPSRRVFEAPAHPYTRKLLAALPGAPRW